MNRLTKNILGIALGSFILIFSFLLVFLPKKTFSENENRYLQTFPKFTIDNLFSGKFVTSFEKYLQDHFPLRDFFVGLKASSEVAIGKDSNKGIYIAKDGYLINAFLELDQANLNKIIEKLNTFNGSLKNVNAHFMLVPSSNLVNGNKLPNDRPDLDQDAFTKEFYEQLKNVNTINVNDILTEKNAFEQLYFKTDHHWNPLGAYYAYAEFMRTLNLEPVSLDSYTKNILSDEFYGTMYSKSGYYNVDADEFFNFTNANGDYNVNYVLSNKVTKTFYEKKYLLKKDKYAYFLDDNHPIIEITNNNLKNGKHIVVIKDSYANCLVPFLADSFEKVTVLDLRFYNSKVSTYLENNAITDILYLFNADGISKDAGLIKLS